MVRIFIYFAILLAAALGLAFLLETPGSVVLTYGGYEYRVTLAKAVAIMIALAMVMMILWTLLRTLLRLPGLMAMSARLRKKQRGYTAISRGLVSVGVGDRRTASRYALEAERLLGPDPMALLLKAQSAQLAGDPKGAEAAFTRMLDDPETRVLGLRGLFMEARRAGKQGARQYAEEAYRIAPASPWAGQAVLEYRTAEHDWKGAMVAVDEAASRRVIDRDTARRQKATLLTAEAREAAETSPERAHTLAMEALRLNPAHVPAAVIAAGRLTARGDYGKATKLLENAWGSVQHPDLAEAYLSVRHGDSTHDRLKRARALHKLAPRSRESALVVARAALDAREFGLARETLEPIVLDQPTARACRLMAELEDKSTGDAGLVRKWLARASIAPRDPAWVADGFVSDTWEPVSPVTGRIDAFEWITPPQSLTASVRAAIDADPDVVAVDSVPQIEGPDASAPTAERVEAPATETAVVAEPKPVAVNVPVPEPEPVRVTDPVKPAPPSIPASAAASVKAGPVVPPVPDLVPVETPPLPKQAPAGVLSQLPDDPGPRHPGEDRNRRS